MLRAHSEHTARETAHSRPDDGVPAQRRPPTACRARRHPRGRVRRGGGAWPLPRHLPAAPHLGVGSRGRRRRGGACAALPAALALPATGWAPPVGATVTSVASSFASSVVAASVARSRCVPPCPHASGGRTPLPAPLALPRPDRPPHLGAALRRPGGRNAALGWHALRGGAPRHRRGRRLAAGALLLAAALRRRSRAAYQPPLRLLLPAAVSLRGEREVEYMNVCSHHHTRGCGLWLCAHARTLRQIGRAHV